jgi:hypothetical protein
VDESDCLIAGGIVTLSGGRGASESRCARELMGMTLRPPTTLLPLLPLTRLTPILPLCVNNEADEDNDEVSIGEDEVDDDDDTDDTDGAVVAPTSAVLLKEVRGDTLTS